MIYSICFVDLIQTFGIMRTVTSARLGGGRNISPPLDLIGLINSICIIFKTLLPTMAVYDYPQDETALATFFLLYPLFKKKKKKKYYLVTFS